MRDPQERLRDILDAITRIECYVARGRDAFDQNELIQVWTVHHLQIIGEAAPQLGRNFHDAHPEVPWPQIITIRNILVHEYFGVDLREVWNAVDARPAQLQARYRGAPEFVAPPPIPYWVRTHTRGYHAFGVRKPRKLLKRRYPGTLKRREQCRE